MHTHESKTPPDNSAEKAIEETLAAHPGLTREALLKHLARQESLTEASTAPFPGPAREAFAAAPQTILGYTLQPVTLELLSALEEIGSPFIEMVEIICAMQGRTQKEISRAIDKKLHPKIKDLVTAAWCFVTPIERVNKTLLLGTPQVRQTALLEISQSLPPAKLSELNAAITAHYVRSFSTSVDYRAKKTEGSGASFPSAPAEPKTASAGAFISAEP